MYQLTHQCN